MSQEDYIKQLEADNEALKKRLEVADLKGECYDYILRNMVTDASHRFATQSKAGEGGYETGENEMNDYIIKLEETIRNQESVIETLRKTNEELVNKYNALTERFNQMVNLTNACGIKETTDGAWTLTMQVGDLPDPKKFKKDNNIDDTIINPLQQDGDEVREIQ